MKPFVKVAFMVLLLLLVLSVVYSGVVAYTIGYREGELCTHKQAIVKTPIDYGIWKHYVAEKLHGEPIYWNTTDELGVVFIKDRFFDHYDVYIFDEEKASPWMNGTKPQPSARAVKYEDELYQIAELWVPPGVGEPNWLVPIGIFLGAGWILTGILFLKLRKKE